jgi:hypothetical protein
MTTTNATKTENRIARILGGNGRECQIQAIAGLRAARATGDTDRAAMHRKRLAGIAHRARRNAR